MIMYYDESGTGIEADEAISVEDQIKRKICAAHYQAKVPHTGVQSASVVQERVQNKYFIRSVNERLYDPQLVMTDYGIPKMMKVSQKTFDLYVAYLKTKRHNFYTAALREV